MKPPTGRRAWATGAGAGQAGFACPREGLARVARGRWPQGWWPDGLRKAATKQRHEFNKALLPFDDAFMAYHRFITVA